MKNNKGFSIIEMLVVIAIIAVLAGVGIFGFSFLQGRGADRAARKIVALLEETQAMSMVKYDNSFLLQIDQDGFITIKQIYKTTEEDNEEIFETKLDDSGVIISYETSSELVTLKEGQQLALSFKRASGEFDYIAGTNDYCYEIYLEKGGTRKHISLTPKTGKISVE